MINSNQSVNNLFPPQFPNEIKVEILDYLSLDDISNLSKTCKALAKDTESFRIFYKQVLAEIKKKKEEYSYGNKKISNFYKEPSENPYPPLTFNIDLQAKNNVNRRGKSSSSAVHFIFQPECEEISSLHFLENSLFSKTFEFKKWTVLKGSHDAQIQHLGLTQILEKLMNQSPSKNKS